MAEQKESKGLKRKRSRILYEITGLVVILMIIMGVLSFLFINSAFDRLIDKSVEKLVEEQAATIHTGLRYVAESETEVIVGDIRQFNMEELLEMTRTSIETEVPSEMILTAVDRLQELVDERVLGLELVFEIAMPAPPIIDEPIILISTDEALIFGEVPEKVLAAVEEAEDGGKAYVYLEEGMPEIGLEGEYLLSLFNMSQVDPLLTGYWGAHFVSMKEAVADINDFYDSERTRSTVIIALIVGGSILLIILITFFVLSYLIRRQITEPIDTLVSAAGEVMEGNLDVEVEVHEGGDFENLERAFKEMVNSIRTYISKSTGEG
jgi:nitrogen fixation/metabolism regulation signal transduction histidine kinase